MELHKQIFRLLIVIGLIVGGLIVSRPQSTYAAPGCNVQVFGTDSAVGPCSNLGAASNNYPFDPTGCYNVILAPGGPPQISQSSCDVPPFAENFISVRCADGSVQSGNNTTAEQLCAGSSGTQEAARDLSDSVNNPQRQSGCTGEQCLTDNSLVQLIRFFINFMSAVVGVVIIAVIVWAGIQYASAGGNPGKTAEAKKRIINAIIALVMYIFLFAFLQWLVPGGVLAT